MRDAQELLKRHAFFVLFFGSLFVLFMYPLLTFRWGLLKGDYGVQFYPWAAEYAKALRGGKILLWTPLLQSGFPIFAEGQTGELYLPNLVLYGLFSLPVAYNLMLLLHLLLGGICAYSFALRKKMSIPAATLVSLVFTFGSATAGDFYNVVTLRTLAWFPLLLLLADRYAENPRLRTLSVLVLIQGQTWLAGFPQMAAYQSFFVLLYGYLRMRERGVSFGSRPLFGFIAGAVWSVLIGSPQIWATLGLSAHSTRVSQDPQFALWGSVAPWAVSSLWMYVWNDYLRCNFYLGIVPLLLVFIKPDFKANRTWWILSAASFFLALGFWNPAYWLFLRFPLISLLRVPSKFLFFTSFFLAMLAGLAMDSVFWVCRQGDPPECRAMRKRVLIAAGSLVLLSFAAVVFVWAGEPLLRTLGKWYVDRFVIGKSFHRASPEVYLERISLILAGLRQDVSLSNVHFWKCVGMVGAGGTLLWGCFQKKRTFLAFSAALLLFVAMDLTVYGKLTPNTNFLGNLGRYGDLPQNRDFPTDGRWLDLTGKLMPPNANLLLGCPQIGVYSPLADKEYFEQVKPLGVVDDSMGFPPIADDAVSAHRSLIDRLGVRYIASDRDIPGYPLLKRVDAWRIYVNPDAVPELALAGGEVSVLRADEASALMKVDSLNGGLLMRRQVFDKGWKAYMGGRQIPVERAETVFQGVRVPPGPHDIRFVFEPDYFRVGLIVHLIALGSAVLAAFFL